MSADVIFPRANIDRRTEKQSKLINMESVEKAVAKSLMDIKAVMLRPDQPFVWASGWHSPIYCDNRRILSFPEIREKVCTWMAEIIRRQYPDVEVIAGVATGAIARIPGRSPSRQAVLLCKTETEGSWYRFADRGYPRAGLKGRDR